MTANPNNGFNPTTLSGLVDNFQHNFLTKKIEIVPGLYFNQYEIVKRVYFYMHNQFESGPTDENGDPKYFYDLVSYRNDQATKNIDIDTKDVYIKAEGTGNNAVMTSWLLRREYSVYAKTSGWGKKLNSLSDDLPDFGTVVWKKIKTKKGTDVRRVDLINLMNDPKVENLQDGMVIERHQLVQSQLLGNKVWDRTAVMTLINSGRTSNKVPYLDTNNMDSSFANVVDETTPVYDVYEVWGEIPRNLYEKYKTNTSKNNNEVAKAVVYGTEKIGGDSKISYNNESVYVMAIVAGVGAGKTECVLFCKEVTRDLFPYKEVHFRRRKGRWLGVGNYEQCFPLIEKANEITNRFFASLRIALLHLYQSRENSHLKNVLTDLIDGDVVVTKSELAIIPTEIRGFTQYKDEMERIENIADRYCNSYEVVTGANLPSGTPFKLGAQQLDTANKLFVHVQEEIGLFIEDVFNDWLLEDFGKSLTKEHVLDLLDDADDIQVYYAAKRKMYQYEVIKRYIMEHSEMPDPQQLALVGELVKDQIAKGPKQVLVEENNYTSYKYRLKVVITQENDTKKENLGTLAELTQVALANPAGLQDPRLMKIINLILEQTGYSPLEINAVNETPTNPLLNPANQGGANQDRSSGGQTPDATAVAAGSTPAPTPVTPGA